MAFDKKEYNRRYRGTHKQSKYGFMITERFLCNKFFGSLRGTIQARIMKCADKWEAVKKWNSLTDDERMKVVRQCQTKAASGLYDYEGVWSESSIFYMT